MMEDNCQYLITPQHLRETKANDNNTSYLVNECVAINMRAHGSHRQSENSDTFTAENICILLRFTSRTTAQNFHILSLILCKGNRNNSKTH